MQDNAPVLIAVCGLATICGGLVLLALFFGVRFVGADLFEYLGGLPSLISGKGDRANINKAEVQQRVERSTNLRAKAQSLDFDAAVAKYEGGQQPTNSPFGAQSAPPLDDASRRSLRGGTPPPSTTDAPAQADDDWSLGDVSSRSLRDRSTPRRDTRRRRGKNDDEVFGGMMDIDGDGGVDF